MRKVVDWEVNTYLIQSILDNSELDLSKALVNLVLLFNSFESKTKWYRYIEKFDLEKIYYLEIFNYFKRRYVTDNKINEKFNGLFRDSYFSPDNLDENDNESRNKKRVIECLLGNNNQDKEKLATCLIIAYRFRNNIFHGKKHICELENYLGCYKVIIELFNNILIHFALQKY